MDEAEGELVMPQGPLSGVRVIDCTQIMAGPYCTMLLGDMGADIVKIEKPDGDDVRRSGPPFIGGESAAYLAVNRNKRSIVIDLKSPQGAEVVRRMVRDADIFVQNMRPGTLQKFGLGYEHLRQVNPALVYGTITGFGSTGPYKDKAGFDLIAQGMSGIMSVTGHPGLDPAKCGVPLTDLTAGLLTAFGILGAYVHRLKTGEGQHVDSSLLEAGVAYTVWESAMFFATGVSPVPNGSAHQLSTPYQAFKTSDGYVTVGGANQSNWERICRAAFREDLLTDPRFTTNADRMTNRPDLVETLALTFAQRSTQYWLEALERVGVPCGPINDMKQVYADPQVQAREMVVEQDHPKSGRIRHIGAPVKMSATPWGVRRPPPLLGQHTDEVLGEFGYGAEEIGNLRKDRVVG